MCVCVCVYARMFKALLVWICILMPFLNSSQVKTFKQIWLFGVRLILCKNLSNVKNCSNV